MNLFYRWFYFLSYIGTCPLISWTRCDPWRKILYNIFIWPLQNSTELQFFTFPCSSYQKCKQNVVYHFFFTPSSWLTLCNLWKEFMFLFISEMFSERTMKPQEIILFRKQTVIFIFNYLHFLIWFHLALSHLRIHLPLSSNFANHLKMHLYG